MYPYPGDSVTLDPNSPEYSFLDMAGIRQPPPGRSKHMHIRYPQIHDSESDSKPDPAHDDKVRGKLHNTPTFDLTRHSRTGGKARARKRARVKEQPTDGSTGSKPDDTENPPATFLTKWLTNPTENRGMIPPPSIRLPAVTTASGKDISRTKRSPQCIAVASSNGDLGASGINQVKRQVGPSRS